MEIKYNGTKISAITFNGSTVKKLIYDNTVVFCSTCSAENSSCGSSCTASSSSSGSSKCGGICSSSNSVCSSPCTVNVGMIKT